MSNHTTSIKTPRQLRIGSAAFFFVSGFGYATWASRIPIIKQQLHLNEAQLGAVLFAMPIGLMLTMPVTSRLLTKYSSRGIMLLGAMLISIILIFLGLVNNMWQLVMMLLCLGSARNLQTLSINTQAVAVQGLYSKSIMATFHGIWSMAGFAGAALGYVMVYFNIGIEYHFAFVSICVFLLSIYFIKHTLYQKPLPQARKPVFSLPDKHLLKFSLICFASMACENTMYDWSALYFQKEVHTQKATSTAAFVVYMIAMTMGRFVGDKLVTRFGIKTVLKFSGLFIFCGLLTAVLLPYPITAGLGFVLVGFGVSCVVPMIFAMAGKSTSISSSTALASISTVGYLGFVLVPPLVGFIAQNASLRWSFGVISVFGAIIVYFVSKINDRQVPDAVVPASHI